jgi:hypothetical protein
VARGAGRANQKSQSARFWYFHPEGWDWLALVRIGVDGARQIFLLPHDRAMALSNPVSDGQRRLQYKNPGLPAYESNFTLGLIAGGDSRLDTMDRQPSLLPAPPDVSSPNDI